MIALIVIAVLASGTSIYFIRRAYILAGLLADEIEYAEQLEFTYDMLLERVKESYDEMNRVDYKGSFKSDDEVGTTFKLLKQIVDDLYEEANGPQKEEE